VINFYFIIFVNNEHQVCVLGGVLTAEKTAVNERDKVCALKELLCYLQGADRE
jgi:hypothetical protein